MGQAGAGFLTERERLEGEWAVTGARQTGTVHLALTSDDNGCAITPLTEDGAQSAEPTRDARCGRSVAIQLLRAGPRQDLAEMT